MKPAKRANIESYAFFEKLSDPVLEHTFEVSYEKHVPYMQMP
jgi:hypothetical protein